MHCIIWYAANGRYRHSSKTADQRSGKNREDAVQGVKWSRRKVLRASAASLAGTLFAQPLKAAAPSATAVTPTLIEAARKEGKLSYYSALELNVAERLGKMFEAKYPGIAVRVERSGAERKSQRIARGLGG